MGFHPAFFGIFRADPRHVPEKLRAPGALSPFINLKIYLVIAVEYHVNLLF
jgi:hypothetical protein